METDGCDVEKLTVYLARSVKAPHYVIETKEALGDQVFVIRVFSNSKLNLILRSTLKQIVLICCLGFALMWTLNQI